MTTDAEVLSLYQAVILEHSRRPRNRRALEGGRRAAGTNPLCGDRIVVYVEIEGGVIIDAAFEGLGCAIFTASASLMTESARGRTVAEVDDLFGQVHGMVTAAAAAPTPDLGPVIALAGVRPFPVRVKCAMLPWQTLRAAARGLSGTVSTE